MQVLALEPYYGGSHRSFIDGWISRSGHQWDLLTLPPSKWKWRMRHSAVTFSWEIEARLASRPTSGAHWDVLFSSDMVNLAELKGLVPASVAQLPMVAYFHENQITYPMRFEKEWDAQFGLSNILTALAASEVWFNSSFHQEDFLGAIPGLLRRMPDFRPLESVERIRPKCRVVPPPVDEIVPREAPREPGPLHIAWAARWEFDKGPEAFFKALESLAHRDVDFVVSVLGEQFREVPEVFAKARDWLGDRIVQWGYLESHEAYLEALARADVYVSTAEHEFFGLSAVEAISLGLWPLLPNRLSYPELLGAAQSEHLYEGSPRVLARRLAGLGGRLKEGHVLKPEPALLERMQSFSWSEAIAPMDTALASAATLDA